MPVDIHCLDCGGSRLTMMNANVEWDIRQQTWVFVETTELTSYLCNDCFADKNGYEEKEIVNA